MGDSTPAAQAHWERMVSSLEERGVLRSPRLASAMRAVPRHEFVASIFRPVWGAAGWSEFRPTPDAHSMDRWYRHIYDPDRPLVLKVSLDATPTISLTAPELVVRMLEALDLPADGAKVLEVGTGTGYNAAIMSCAVGPTGSVHTVEIDSAAVESARERLARRGATSICVYNGDGRLGLPSQAPFDRILSTAGLERVPEAWLRQVRPDGLIVACMQGRLSGAIVPLRSHDGAWQGRFNPGPLSGFIPMRGPNDATAAVPAIFITAPILQRVMETSQFDPSTLDRDASSFPFFLQEECPFVNVLWELPAESQAAEAWRAPIVIDTRTGTNFVCRRRDSDDRWQIDVRIDAGLLDVVVEAYQSWRGHTSPAPDRYRYVVLPDGTQEMQLLSGSQVVKTWPRSAR